MYVGKPSQKTSLRLLANPDLGIVFVDMSDVVGDEWEKAIAVDEVTFTLPQDKYDGNFKGS